MNTTTTTTTTTIDPCCPACGERVRGERYALTAGERCCNVDCARDYRAANELRTVVYVVRDGMKVKA